MLIIENTGTTEQIVFFFFFTMESPNWNVNRYYEKDRLLPTVKMTQASLQ